MTICVLERECSECDGMVLGVFSTEDLAQRAASAQAKLEYPASRIIEWKWYDGALIHPQIATSYSISPLSLDEFTPRVYAI